MCYYPESPEVTPRFGRRDFLELAIGTGLTTLATGANGAETAHGQSGPPWDTFHGDRRRTGYVPDGAAVTENPRVQWFVRTNYEFAGPESNPLVFEDVVYALARTPPESTALTGDRQVVAVDRADGTELWRSDLPSGGIRGCLAVSDRTLFLNGTEDVQAIDRETGRRRWAASDFTDDVDLTPSGSPLVVDGDVYVLGTGPGGENGLFVLDTETGDPEWRVRLDSLDFPGTPSYHDGLVFVPSGTRTLHAIDVESREERWQFEAETAFRRAPPSVRDGTVYAVGDGTLYAIDAGDGSEQWQWDADTSPGALAVTGGRVLHGQAQGVAAYDAGEGFQQWQTDRAGGYESPPTVVGDTVYAMLGPNESRLVAFDLETGAERWALPIGGQGDAGVSYYDGRLYVNEAGRLFAIEAGAASEPPDPSISHDPEYAPSGEEVTFTATVENGSAEHYLWTISGVYKAGETVSYTFQYDTGGNRQVRLLAIDDDGAVGMATGEVPPSEDGFETPPPPTETATPTERPTTEPTAAPEPSPASETATVGPTEMRAETGTANGTGREQDPGNGPSLGREELLALGGGGGIVALLGLYAAAKGTTGGTDSSGDSGPDSGTSPSEDGSMTGSGERHERVARLVSNARDARERGEYEQALASFETALSVAKRGDERGSGPELRARIDEVQSLREATEEERDAHRLVTNGLDRIDEELGGVAEMLDDGRPEAAVDRLDDVSSAIEHARELVEEHGFSGVSGRLTEQAHRCETLRSRAHSTLRTASVERMPESIPSGPSVDASTVDPEDALSPGGEKTVIGWGRQSVVCRRSLTLDGEQTTVAVKELQSDGTLHADEVEQFVERARTWQALDDHDHVVSVVDYDTDPLPWIAMEYMDSGHLGTRAGEMPFTQALWTALSVTRAIRHAHRRGVSHLRLTPENVLFRAVEGRWDAPKVADWGVSERLASGSDSSATERFRYAAPEQFEESYGAVDDITDVYQIGAVCYELFTGRPPFDGQSSRVMYGVLNEQPTPPSELADVPESLDEILQRALATEKADRYESVLYLRDELEALFGARWDE
jgi:outer membrane protein assembly factor BamB/serine/threonine protein kinase